MSDDSRSPRSRARRRGYLLAAAIAVVGLVGAGTWAGTALIAEAYRPATFERTAVPGTGTVTLAGGDVRVVYAEGTATPPTPEQVHVTAPDGADVPLRPYRGELEYDVPDGTGVGGPDGAPGRLGVAVASFTAPEPGSYEVGSASGSGTLAVGPDLAPGALRAVTLPAGLGLLALLGGLALAVRTATLSTNGA
ncbi:hypothetical protein Q9R32_05080 [Actinotalea sp. AC32]|nr:hypothetical protein [Actinotalea sp. AC32]